MTRYKILKDLLWLEAWKIIENEKIFSLSYLKENWWLEEIKESKSIYNLEHWDKYYYIDNCITVENSYWYWDVDDYSILETWNVFLTKEEAEKELNKRKALSKIKRWIWKNEIELSKDFDWYTIYAIPEEVVVWENLYCRNEFGIIFYSKEDAKKCLEECKQEREILYELN